MDLAALTDTAKGDELTLRRCVGAQVTPGALTQLLISCLSPPGPLADSRAF